MDPRRNQTINDAIAKTFGDKPEVIAAVHNILGGTPGVSADSASFAHLLAHSSPKDLETLMNATSPLDESPNLDAFDFTKVSVKVNSFWVVQLMHMSYETSDGKISDTYVEGSQPTFNFVIYDETSSFRIAEPLKKAGLPSSDVVLQCIKRAIASPMPPLSKSLPGLLLIALKLEPHVTTLRLFLDSLPAPFTWRLETPSALRLPLMLGNDAMKRKNRPDAVRHYTDAVGWLWGAASQKPDTKELKEIDALWSVCLGNHAVAYLMDGEGQDAAKALQDALEACKLNKDYAKAYYRQAQAFQILNEQSKAIEAIIAALHRPSLSKDKSLNDTLLELYGGLPDSGPDIQAFCVKVFKGTPDVTGLSEFRRRVNERIRKVLGEESSLRVFGRCKARQFEPKWEGSARFAQS